MRPPSSRRILLVDDDAGCREAFVCLFESWGCETIAAACPGDALSRMAERLPDVIVADLGLPTIAHGITMIREARRMPGADSIPILALSGHGQDVDRRAAIRAGCDFFFLKPPDLDHLRDALTATASERRVLNAHRR